MPKPILLGVVKIHHGGLHCTLRQDGGERGDWYVCKDGTVWRASANVENPSDHLPVVAVRSGRELEQVVAALVHDLAGKDEQLWGLDQDKINAEASRRAAYEELRRLRAEVPRLKEALVEARDQRDFAITVADELRQILGIREPAP
jgi:hypothetical protein